MPHPAGSGDQRNTIWGKVELGGVLKKELIGHLRSRRRMRRVKHASTAGQRRGQILDGLSIRDRPADVGDRAIPGHWEGDLITGSQNTHMATLVERQSHLHPVGEGAGKRHHQRGDGTEHTDTTIASGIVPVINLGSRNGIGPAQTIDGRYHGAGLFL
jgi:hypothetical protein